LSCLACLARLPVIQIQQHFNCAWDTPLGPIILILTPLLSPLSSIKEAQAESAHLVQERKRIPRSRR
jgi:hypothetical protein